MEDRNLDRSLRDQNNGYHQVAVGLVSHQPQAEPFQLKVISHSMSPFLNPGDLINVLVSPTPDLKRGDIIIRLEKSPDNDMDVDWIVHRLVGKTKQGWVTKGDHRHALDPPISDHAIVGKVIQVYHNGQWIDLRRFPWNWFNRFLGCYHFGYGILFTHLRRMRGRLKSVRGVK